MTAPTLFRSHWERLLGACESPIESLFLAAFCDLAVARGYQVGRRPTRSDTIAVQPQKTVDRYRLDVAVALAFHRREVHVAIEMDGHAFHERTLSQARQDRQRERALMDLGYEVRRFTGSEINGDAAGCAGEVMNLIESFQSRCIDDDWRRRSGRVLQA